LKKVTWKKTVAGRAEVQKLTQIKGVTRVVQRTCLRKSLSRVTKGAEETMNLVGVQRKAKQKGSRVAKVIGLQKTQKGKK